MKEFQQNDTHETRSGPVSDSKNSNWMNCLLIWIPKCIPFQWRVQKSCIVGIRDSWANTDSFEMLTNTIQPESIRTSDNIVFFPEADVSCENDSNCSFTPASAVLFACTVTIFLYALVLQLFKGTLCHSCLMSSSFAVRCRTVQSVLWLISSFPGRDSNQLCLSSLVRFFHA